MTSVLRKKYKNMTAVTIRLCWAKIKEKSRGCAYKLGIYKHLGKLF
jgi:hypothetical protein